jgi:hypothetical protein
MQARTVKRLALSLPETQEKLTWEEPTFRVRYKMFAMFADRQRALWVRSTHDEQRAPCQMDPETFFPPPYVGPSGWVGVHFKQVDPDELHELLIEAWRMTAPKRLVAEFDAEHGAER